MDAPNRTSNAEAVRPSVASEPSPQLELVPTVPVSPVREPEQLLIRMLEVVRDRVESIHAGQRTVVEQLRDVKASLPVQRKPLSKRTQALHVTVIATRRNGLCPCCQEVPVCTASGRLDAAEFDHWYSRHQARATQTWLVCADCNVRLLNTEFKAAARSAFESYQQALRPLLTRQMALGLAEPKGATGELHGHR